MTKKKLKPSITKYHYKLLLGYLAISFPLHAAQQLSEEVKVKTETSQVQVHSQQSNTSASQEIRLEDVMEKGVIQMLVDENQGLMQELHQTKQELQAQKLFYQLQLVAQLDTEKRMEELCQKMFDQHVWYCQQLRDQQERGLHLLRKEKRLQQQRATQQLLAQENQYHQRLSDQREQISQLQQLLEQYKQKLNTEQPREPFEEHEAKSNLGTRLKKK